MPVLVKRINFVGRVPVSGLDFWPERTGVVMALPLRNPWFPKIVLGLLVAATGVGAGDLITAGLSDPDLARLRGSDQG